jgi:threonine dehydratase
MTTHERGREHSSPMISVSEMRNAAEFLKGSVIHTPLVYSPTFSKMTGFEVFLKLENLQETGSFKLRGASWKIFSASDRIGLGGVVAASAGNHAQGVALAGRRAGFKTTIVMPEWASITKQEATRNYGGEVVLEGQSVGDSIQKALELAQTGKTFIHPYDDPDIINGQGTIGLEIYEDLRDPDAIFVPIGGGGLISGIAVACKALRPETRIIGVQAAACPSAQRAISNGMPLRVEAGRSIADGIAVKQVGEITFPIIREKVDDIVLVEEEEVAAAVLMLLERKKVLAEGAGAVPLAALLNGSVRLRPGCKVVLVISGGNVDSPLLDRVIRKGLFRGGRIMRISVCLDDTPGALASILTLIARHKANVLHIHHYRSGSDLPVYLSHVELELETRSADHIGEVKEMLRRAGYQIRVFFEGDSEMFRGSCDS